LNLLFSRVNNDDYNCPVVPIKNDQ
jgi:hypothetical protein